MLLAQWARTHPEVDLVWLEVAVEDNDPVRFSRRLLEGLAAINPDVADLAALVSLHGGGLGEPMLEAFETQLEEFPEVLIVLDDLHHLSNANLVSDLGSLAQLIPPNIHLVLSTRTDLPIAWSRHRLKQELTEIRQADLALDEADSSLLLERITGRTLGPDGVASLVARTEGWAAGLQLAGMTLRLYHDSDEFITQFSGDDRLIADYLSEEVLQSLSNDRRQLLLRVSVLDKMCSELVSHLTGEPNAQLVLDQLERESMFLVSLDGHRQWFRFHHLFRDMLRFTLRAEQPGTEPRLLTQAASWHLERGEVDTGIEYLLDARNWAEAINVIMTRGSEVFEKGEMATVIRWISQIPESARAGRRDVSLLLGALMGVEGLAAGSEDVLGRVVADVEASDGERLCALVFLATMVQWRPRPETSLEMAARALDMLHQIGDAPIPSIMNLSHVQSLETMALLSRGRAHFQGGDVEQARDWLERGLETLGATYPIWKVSGLGSLAMVEAWSGNSERAASLSEEALAVAREVGLLNHPCAADAYLASTLTALELGEPGRASLSLHEGTVRAEANRRSQLSWFGHLAKALLLEADGQRDQAMTTVLSARNDLGAPPPPIVMDRMQALHSRLLRLDGSPEQALRTFDPMSDYAEASTFEHAAAALALGDLNLARKLIGTFDDPSDMTEPLAIVESLLLMAWSADAEGSENEAQMHLAGALAVAERHSLVDVFVRAGPAILRLISGLTSDPSPLRDRVLERARQLIAPSPGVDLVDPLTDRELEILSYLPSRFTNTELADHFYVSVNTIKTHMAHIYRKLDVANRNGAIDRARELGML